MNKIQPKEYYVEIDLETKDYGVIETIDTVGRFDTFDEAMRFAKTYAKDKKNFKRKWLKKADEIVLTIRHNYEFDKDGNPTEFDDEDYVKVKLKEK